MKPENEHEHEHEHGGDGDGTGFGFAPSRVDQTRLDKMRLTIITEVTKEKFLAFPLGSEIVMIGTPTTNENTTGVAMTAITPDVRKSLLDSGAPSSAKIAPIAILLLPDVTIPDEPSDTPDASARPTPASMFNALIDSATAEASDSSAEQIRGIIMTTVDLARRGYVPKPF